MRPRDIPQSPAGECGGKERFKVKICGLSRKEDILYANEAYPDYVGFVFAKSRRQVSAEQAAGLRKLLREGICPVGVFVNEKPERVVEFLQRGIIDAAQLHGQETEEEIKYIRRKSGKKVIKALQVSDGREWEAWKFSEADYLLLDGGSGDGRPFDWSMCGMADALEKPFFLAGGLNASNAAEAVHRFRPFALDVSSGVESAGRKDRKKMVEFMRAVRLAEKEAGVHSKHTDAGKRKENM